MEGRPHRDRLLNDLKQICCYHLAQIITYRWTLGDNPYQRK
jgi:hypothetical protein